jgi:hypothetical protein
MELIMFNKKGYNKNIHPDCAYCLYGSSVEDNNSDDSSTAVFIAKKIICKRNVKHIVNSSCRRFKYDPLKREPKHAAPLPEYSMKDFEL